MKYEEQLRQEQVSAYLARLEITVPIRNDLQSLNTLLASGMAPVLAFAKSGVSNDPISDYAQSEKWVKMIWGDPDKVDEVEQQTTGQGEANILQEERPTDQPDDGAEA